MACPFFFLQILSFIVLLTFKGLFTLSAWHFCSGDNPHGLGPISLEGAQLRHQSRDERPPHFHGTLLGVHFSVLMGLLPPQTVHKYLFFLNQACQPLLLSVALQSGS